MRIEGHRNIFSIFAENHEVPGQFNSKGAGVPVRFAPLLSSLSVMPLVCPLRVPYVSLTCPLRVPYVGHFVCRAYVPLHVPLFLRVPNPLGHTKRPPRSGSVAAPNLLDPTCLVPAGHCPYPDHTPEHQPVAKQTCRCYQPRSRRCRRR